jgi:hypothetical protein
VTRREDIGAGLHAPQTKENNEEFWSYSLINEIKIGDLVYHDDGIVQAIVAHSTATGVVRPGEVLWAARG